MDNNRIDAPAKVMETIKRAQETMQRMQAEIDAMMFGASVALNVPDSWRWDGKGWAAPVEDDETKTARPG